MKAASEERLYKIYTSDSFYSILGALGNRGGKRFADIAWPKPQDERDPKQIALERAERMGLKVVS